MVQGADNSETQSEFEAYDRLVSSYTFGIVRMYRARIVTNTALMAINLFHNTEDPGKEAVDFAIKSQISKISAEDFDSFRYISNISALVYGTTIFDTFLSGSAKFLLFKFPRTLGDATIELSDVIVSDSKESIIQDVVEKKVRSMSFSGFPERLRYLRKTFDLKFDLDSETKKNLEHFSTMRNVISHDQGVHDLKLSPDGHLSAVQKTCAIHPTIVTNEDVFGAWNAYRASTLAIYSSIVTQVLGAADNPQAKKVIKWLEHET